MTKNEVEEYAENMKSNHVSPKKLDDGSWVCNLCGAESMDQELFEVLAAENECIRQGTEMGVFEDENDIPWAEVNSAREWMRSASKAAKKAREEFEALGKSAKAFSEAVR